VKIDVESDQHKSKTSFEILQKDKRRESLEEGIRRQSLNKSQLVDERIEKLSKKASLICNSQKSRYIDLNEVPWGKHSNDDYVIAISGKAFKMFIHDRIELFTKKTGQVYDFEELIQKDLVLKLFLTKCLVYARMKPDQKSEAVSYLQELYKKDGILVGFCGDGANDCGALKTAHIGISLSMSEASVAAPFTSNITNISSVILVCQEGRSALATSFQSFKYLCYYSIMQCFGMILLYFALIDYSFIMYLVNDLFIVFP